jgi:hypothetical protein
MKATILTAFNRAFHHIGSICAHSIKTYAAAQGLKAAVEEIPEEYTRPASWAKVNLIRKHLRETDYVMWVDADALIIGTNDFKTIIEPVTLNISKDANGINCGVMCWRNDGQSDRILGAMDDLYERYQEDPWFEQRALMTIIEGEVLLREDNVYYQPKHLFNAYPGEQTAHTLVLHFPGMPTPEDRVEPMMNAALNAKI